MGYLAYIFSMFLDIANKIKIPIPISQNFVMNLSISSILFGLIILGLIIYFIARLLQFEINWSFKRLGYAQTNNFKTTTKSDGKSSIDREYIKTMKIKK